jgi:hypothetical protein
MSGLDYQNSASERRVSGGVAIFWYTNLVDDAIATQTIERSPVCYNQSNSHLHITEVCKLS